VGGTSAITSTVRQSARPGGKGVKQSTKAPIKRRKNQSKPLSKPPIPGMKTAHAASKTAFQTGQAATKATQAAKKLRQIHYPHGQNGR
jgi:hypothetical protein